MLSVTQTTDEVVIIDAAGTLTEEDYRRFDRELSALAERDHQMRMLVRLTDFHGWRPNALWEEVKLDVAYKDVIDRVAVVGERRWQDWMTRLARPFTGDVAVRYFDDSAAAGAMGWLLEAQR